MSAAGIYTRKKIRTSPMADTVFSLINENAKVEIGWDNDLLRECAKAIYIEATDKLNDYVKIGAKFPHAEHFIYISGSINSSVESAPMAIFEKIKADDDFYKKLTNGFINFIGISVEQVNSKIYFVVLGYFMELGEDKEKLNTVLNGCLNDKSECTPEKLVDIFNKAISVKNHEPLILDMEETNFVNEATKGICQANIETIQNNLTKKYNLFGTYIIVRLSSIEVANVIEKLFTSSAFVEVIFSAIHNVGIVFQRGTDGIYFVLGSTIESFMTVKKLNAQEFGKTRNGRNRFAKPEFVEFNSVDTRKQGMASIMEYVDSAFAAINGPTLTANQELRRRLDSETNRTDDPNEIKKWAYQYSGKYFISVVSAPISAQTSFDIRCDIYNRIREFNTVAENASAIVLSIVPDKRTALIILGELHNGVIIPTPEAIEKKGQRREERTIERQEKPEPKYQRAERKYEKPEKKPENKKNDRNDRKNDRYDRKNDKNDKNDKNEKRSEKAETGLVNLVPDSIKKINEYRVSMELKELAEASPEVNATLEEEIKRFTESGLVSRISAKAANRIRDKIGKGTEILTLCYSIKLSEPVLLAQFSDTIKEKRYSEIILSESASQVAIRFLRTHGNWIVMAFFVPLE